MTAPLRVLGQTIVHLRGLRGQAHRVRLFSAHLRLPRISHRSTNVLSSRPEARNASTAGADATRARHT
ncbi:hypothetical protein ACFV2U_54500 [Streptomyces sp. NPDC059697]|uniref:hypothetical protein n=1 Tax=Streptomyces sp. NPDC059697 TaxID=3346912 RepID=UPI0036CBD366